MFPLLSGIFWEHVKDDGSKCVLLSDAGGSSKCARLVKDRRFEIRGSLRKRFIKTVWGWMECFVITEKHFFCGATSTTLEC